MKSTRISTEKTSAQTLPSQEWIPFLAQFTVENRGAHARLDIVGATADVGYQVETEDRPFDGVAADTKGSESTVWITFVSAAGGRGARGGRRAAAGQGRGAGAS